MVLDTRVPGDPAALSAAAAHLRNQIAAGAGRLADGVTAQRSSLGQGWEGAAGSAFDARASALAVAGDEVAELTRASAATLDRLAVVLSATQRGLAAVRGVCVQAGLTVLYEQVQQPDPTTDPATYRRLVTVFDAARTHGDALRQGWDLALEAAASEIVRRHASTVSATGSLLVTGQSAYLTGRQVQVMRAEARHQAGEAVRHRGRAAEMAELMREGRVPANLDDYDDLLARARHADDLAAAAQDAAKHPRLPGAARGLLGSMEVLGAGYGIYDDIQQGESTTQAVTSQSAAAASGILAGAATGALIGSSFPVVGTIAGGVVGALAGVAVDKGVDRWGFGEGEESDPEKQRDTEATRASTIGLLLEPLQAPPDPSLIGAIQ